MAPEVGTLDKPFDEKSAMWSLGIVLIEMLDRELPTSKITQIKDVSTQPLPVLKRKVTKRTEHIVRALLRFEPSERMNIHQLRGVSI